MMIKLTATDHDLFQLRLSFSIPTRFSKTAVTVEKLANTIKTKKRVPQILPPINYGVSVFIPLKFAAFDLYSFLKTL